MWHRTYLFVDEWFTLQWDVYRVGGTRFYEVCEVWGTDKDNCMQTIMMIKDILLIRFSDMRDKAGHL